MSDRLDFFVRKRLIFTQKGRTFEHAASMRSLELSTAMIVGLTSYRLKRS
jgi:hypothetical protein